jgi:environmental stress-induced protein Ves
MAARLVRHLRASDARVSPWKNGRGSTRELALGPEHASFERGDFDWRISAAGVAEPGPFSVFHGFERVLVVTSGAGLVLEHGPHAPRARLRRMEPYRFSGDWPTGAELVGGPVEDFNVLARRGCFEAEALAVELGARVLRESLGEALVFAHVLARATARVSGEEAPFELAAGDSLAITGTLAHDEIEISGKHDSCGVILVRVSAARGGGG